MFSSILHSLIAHHDLKPENVLMTTTNEKADLRMLDFDLSKIIEPEEKCQNHMEFYQM